MCSARRVFRAAAALKKARQLRPGAAVDKKIDGRPRPLRLLEALARPCSLAFGKKLERRQT
jgi:hypothetical protein